MDIETRPIKVAMFSSKKNDVEYFKAANSDGKFDISFFEEKLDPKTASMAEGFDAVSVFTNDVVDEKVINVLAGKGVKLIALRCAGYNNVNLAAARGKITVVNVPDYSPYAVAEHAMAILLAALRHIPKAYNRTRDFNFEIDGLIGTELHGKTVGVIGTGKIGKAFINICKGFGAKVIACDKFQDEQSGIEYVDREDLFRNSDIISIHCPLTNLSHHIINRNSISKMKKGVIIVNTSRGGLIDSDSLLDALISGKIKAACLDVYEDEAGVFFQDLSDDIVKDDVLVRLLNMPNVIITPHQAFFTDEALTNITETTLKNISEFFATGKCENQL